MPRSSSSAQPDQPPSVLSTLNSDGSRKWLKPRPSPGRFLSRRRAVAYALIALFTLIPYVKVDGKPWVLLDVVHRKFTILGVTFLPTDTVLLALLILSVFVSIFLITAVLGRVWCGWGCPQTVYMEFLFRPLERFFEGTPGRAKKGGFVGSALAKMLKHITFILVSCYLAHTFLAYFVGVDQLRTWVTGSPAKHPVGFGVMAITTGLMLFDFGFFREQVCLVACPYGRFQSVMLDRRSLIVAYDTTRGEPRGTRKGKDLSLPVVEGAPRTADCVDCGLCVTTCPTGIDIRNGLQMECVHCTQCIDACDAVMAKLSRPKGLIRYASQAELAGEPARRLGTRVFIYSTILTVLVSVLTTLLLTRPDANMLVIRGRGAPFMQVSEVFTGNTVSIKLTNRLPSAATYSLGLTGPEGAYLRTEESSVRLESGERRQVPATIVVPTASFRNGAIDVKVTVKGEQGFTAERSFRVVGPGSLHHPAPPAEKHGADERDHDDDQ